MLWMHVNDALGGVSLRPQFLREGVERQYAHLLRSVRDDQDISAVLRAVVAQSGGGAVDVARFGPEWLAGAQYCFAEHKPYHGPDWSQVPERTRRRLEAVSLNHTPPEEKESFVVHVLFSHPVAPQNPVYLFAGLDPESTSDTGYRLVVPSQRTLVSTVLRPLAVELKSTAWNMRVT